MSRFLKQSTASQTRTIGPFLDDTDFKTAETGLTVANTDIRLKKNGANDVDKNSGGATHDVNGCYHLTFDATDTDTVGELFYSVKVAGALQVFGCFTVLEEAIYDALFSASANAFSGAAGSTTLTALASGSITAAVVATGAIDADAIADNAIDAGAIASDAITAAKIASDAITAAKIASDAISAAKIATGAITAAKFAAGAIDAAAIADGAIDAATFAAGAIDSAAMNVTGSEFTAIPWNAAWDAEVQSEVDDALVAQNLDHLVKIAVDTNFATTVHADSVIGQLADNGAGFDRTTDSLEAIRDRGDAAWITATGFSTHSAADVWAVATRVLTAGTNINGSTFTAIPWSASWDAEVQSEVVDALQETIPDSVPADGTRPSVQSALYMMCQGLFEGSISGTTWTVKKVDGSTTLFTVTLDSATTPTSKTRAT